MTQRRHGWLIFAIVALLILGWAMVARAADVRIWPGASVADADIRLGDIASLRGLEPDQRAVLEAVVVRQSPEPGGRVVLTFDEIRRVLQAQEAANLATLSLCGASRCVVVRPRPIQPPEERIPRPAVARASDGRSSRADAPARSKEAREAARAAAAARRAEAEAATSRHGPLADTLEAKLIDYLLARVGEDTGRVEVRFGEANREVLALSARRHTFHIRAEHDQRLGLVSVEAEVIEPGHSVKRYPFVAQVELVRDVVIARRPINHGQKIDARDLQLSERRFTDQRGMGVTDLEAVVGKEARRFFKPGQMLEARYLAEPPLVQRGDLVTIYVRRGALTIKTSGRAQESGTLGQIIEVRRDGTRRRQDLIEAVVTGPGTVTQRDEAQVARR